MFPTPAADLSSTKIVGQARPYCAPGFDRVRTTLANISEATSAARFNVLFTGNPGVDAANEPLITEVSCRASRKEVLRQYSNQMSKPTSTTHVQTLIVRLD